MLDAYPDLSLGLADASMLVLANRYSESRIFMLDQRHFRVLRSVAGGWFEILPANSAFE